MLGAPATTATRLVVARFPTKRFVASREHSEARGAVRRRSIMSGAIMVLEISEIECRGLRSADFLSKNDVYVVLKVGTKKCKTKYISNAGKNARFPEMMTLNVSDADLMQGVELQAWDYDLTSSDDLLGIGALRRLDELKKFPGQVRQFQCPLMYKGKHRGEASCHCKLKMPGGGAAASSARGLSKTTLRGTENRAPWWSVSP